MEKGAGFISCRDRLRAFAMKSLAETATVLKTPRRAAL